MTEAEYFQVLAANDSAFRSAIEHGARFGLSIAPALSARAIADETAARLMFDAMLEGRLKPDKGAKK